MNHVLLNILYGGCQLIGTPENPGPYLIWAAIDHKFAFMAAELLERCL